jgi:flavodoxin
MRILAVIASSHMGNTKKIAEAMSETVPMTIIDINDAQKYDFRDYDIIGFGSGIYYGKHDKRLFELADTLTEDKSYAFVFSTSGMGADKDNRALAESLERKNKIILGSFACKGLYKYFIFKLIGGKNKGHPDKNDLKNAQNFIKCVTEKYKKPEGK